MTEEELEVFKAHILAMFERLKENLESIYKAILNWAETLSQWLMSRIDWDKWRELVEALRPLVLYIKAHKRLKANRGVRFVYRLSSVQAINHIVRLRLGLE